MSEELNYKSISYLMRGGRRKKVLSSLKIPKRPKEIAGECGLNISNVSVALSELSKEKLIECITPKEKIFKFFRITKKGQIALSNLEKYNGNSK